MRPTPAHGGRRRHGHVRRRAPGRGGDRPARPDRPLRGLIARFAARHATAAQLDALDAVLDEADDLLVVIKQRDAEGRSVEKHLDALLDTVQRFNDAVAECAGNAVLVRLLDQTRVFTRAERRTRAVERVLADHRYGLDRYTKHRALVRALRAGDSVAAEQLALDDVRGGLEDLRREPGQVSAR